MNLLDPPQTKTRRRSGFLFILLTAIVLWAAHLALNMFMIGDYTDIQKNIPAFLPASEPLLHTPPQQNNQTTALPFLFRRYTLTPVATYAMTARVLGVEYYFLDHLSSLSPVDLALGWQEMGDLSTLSQISFSQGARFYTWRTSDWPLERHEIETMSANTHIIPATPDIERRVRKLTTGDVVTLSGYLVNATGIDGFQWNTSTSRTDTGMGACEILFVQNIAVR